MRRKEAIHSEETHPSPRPPKAPLDFLLPFTHNFYLTSGHFLYIGSFKCTSLGTGLLVSPLNWVDLGPNFPVLFSHAFYFF